MNTNSSSLSKILFFGTSEFSVIVLNRLKTRGILPTAIVTTPDKPQGRRLILTPPPTKLWALEQNPQIPVLQFDKLNDEAITEIKASSESIIHAPFDLFIVASYGKIIPQKVLDIPAHGSLNVHPSLLPLYRGASPLQSSIIADDKHTGVTIIQMDALMDHGPIVAMKEVLIDPWPASFSSLEKTLGEIGVDILADALPAYIDGSLKPVVQDESKATFTKKITKEDGLIVVDANATSNDSVSTLTETIATDDQYTNYLKFHAFEQWPGTYFFTERKGKTIRVKIKNADFIDKKFIPTRIIPEGGKEMNYEDFLKGL